METERANNVANDERIVLFKESTHGHFYNATTNIWDKILAVYVLVLQFLVYILLMIVALDELSEKTVSVTINTEECEWFNDVPVTNSTIERFEDGFGCSAIDKTSPVYIICIFAAIAVVSKFLLHDIVASIRGFKINFIASIFILLEAVLAFVTGFAFVLDGLQTSSTDILMGAIGVIFVHDIDETVRKATNMLPNNYLVFVVPLGVTIIFIVLGFSLSQVLLTDA